MTTKEIAEAVGKKERAIRNWVVKAGANNAAVEAKNAASGHGRSADYDLNETCSIIEAGMGVNAASIYRQNAEQNKPDNIDHVDREYKLAIAGLYKMLESHESRLSQIEHEQASRKALAPPPSKSPRQELSQIMRKLAATKYNNEHKLAWADLYRELYYRCSINVTARARHDGVKGVDVLEREGMLETAASIAMELLA